MKTISIIAYLVLCFLAGMKAGELAWEVVKHFELENAVRVAIVLLMLASAVACAILSRTGVK